jgi:hypothetical protein
MRIAARLLLLILAAFGPLAPVLVLFLIAIPPLLAFSGWAWWVDLPAGMLDCGLIVGAALWLGPEALASARAFLEEERHR